MDESSVYGLISLYLAFQSNTTGKSINLIEIQKISGCSQDYLYAYIVASTCMKLVNCSSIKTVQNGITIYCNYYHPIHLQNIREKVVKSIEINIKGDIVVEFITKLNQIDKYINEI